VIDVVPRATQVVVDFINSFRSPEEIENLDSINRLISEQESKISELAQTRQEYQGQQGYNITAENDEIQTKQRLTAEIGNETERLNELITKRGELLEQQKRMANAETPEGGSISANLGTGSGGRGASTSDQEQIEAIMNRFKTEEELLIEKFEREKELLLEHNQSITELEQEFTENWVAMRIGAYEKDAAAKERAQRDGEAATRRELRDQQKAEKQKNRSKRIQQLVTACALLLC
jgi:hypothetical protein